MSEEWIDAREVARRLQLNEGTVRRWACRGIIPCVRPTRKVLRFSWPAVKSALERRRAETA